MSPRLLQLRSFLPTDERLPVSWVLERPTSGVVLFDVKVGTDASAAPLHWRVGDWAKPPMDVALSKEGFIEGVQLVLQDEAVAMIDVVLPDTARSGTPKFDVDLWPQDRYLDVRRVLTTSHLASGELFAATGADVVVQQYVEPGKGLLIGLDSEDRVVALAIGPLSGEEWQLIEAAAG